MHVFPIALLVDIPDRIIESVIVLWHEYEESNMNNLIISMACSSLPMPYTFAIVADK